MVNGSLVPNFINLVFEIQVDKYSISYAAVHKSLWMDQDLLGSLSLVSELLLVSCMYSKFSFAMTVFQVQVPSPRPNFKSTFVCVCTRIDRLVD